MDRRLLFALPGFLVLIVVVIALWFVLHAKHVPVPAVPSTATSTPDLSGQAIYTNGEFGFYLVYPETAKVENDFKTYYHLPSSWRVNADADASGTPVVAIVEYRVENDHSYPRYYDAEVRIGTSKESAAVRNCVTASNGETTLADTVINGTSFKTFSFESAGMMQYLKGVSYRAVHSGTCYAIEKIATGSSYKDDPASSADIPDAMLNSKYASLDAIVHSFSFAGT